MRPCPSSVCACLPQGMRGCTSKTCACLWIVRVSAAGDAQLHPQDLQLPVDHAPVDHVHPSLTQPSILAACQGGVLPLLLAPVLPPPARYTHPACGQWCGPGQGVHIAAPCASGACLAARCQSQVMQHRPPLCTSHAPPLQVAIGIGDLTLAYQCLRCATAIDPGHVEATNNLGVLEHRSGGEEQARAYFRHVHVCAPANCFHMHLVCVCALEIELYRCWVRREEVCAPWCKRYACTGRI